MGASIRNKLRYALLKILERFGYYYPKRLQYKHLVRYFYFHDLYREIEDVPGDIVECGVAYGESLIVWATLAKQEEKGRKVYGFDSFEGFPEPSAHDTSERHAKKGEFGDARMNLVRSMLQKASVPMPTLVKGFVEDTAKTYDGTIALLHIDVDLYEGYKAVLEHLFDKVAPGGIVAFDEYRDPHWPGATKAVDEFLKGRYPVQKARYVNKYYIVKK